MVRFLKILAAAAVAISVTAAPAAAQRHGGTHVYLLRGFMDIFSTGMDDLGAKMSRRGIRASVHNHSEFQNLAASIIERHKKGIRENVVIIGHSLGGNDAFRMAEYLGAAKITVPLIIAFDPTASMAVPSNVSRVVNFYSSTNGWGVPIVRGPGFRGSLSNVDLARRGEMGHTDIDKSSALHSQSINYVLGVGGSRRSTGTAATPKPDPREKEEKKADSAAKESANESESKMAEEKSTKDSVAKADAKAGAADKESGAAKSAAKTDSKPATDSLAAAEPKASAKAAATAPETTGSADAKKSSDAKPVAEKSAAEKPAAEKTTTAASKSDDSKTSN